MTKTSIKNMLVRAAEGREVISKAELKRCMGWGDAKTSRILGSLDGFKISSGKNAKKQYLVDDVAAAIVAYVE